MKVCTIARASDTGVLRAQQKMHNTTVVERDLNDYASNDEDNDIRWRFWWWWYTLALSTMDENSISLWEFIQRLPHRRPQHLVHHHHQHRHHSGGDHGVCQTPSTPFHCDHLRSFSGHQAITRWSIVDYIATTRWSCSLSLWKYDWLRLEQLLLTSTSGSSCCCRSSLSCREVTFTFKHHSSYDWNTMIHTGCKGRLGKPQRRR